MYKRQAHGTRRSSTLYDLLCSQPEGEAVRLATALEIYVSGSLNVFNHETNVDLNRRLVCLDLKKLGAGLRTIAMLIMQDLVCLLYTSGDKTADGGRRCRSDRSSAYPSAVRAVQLNVTRCPFFQKRS